MALQENIIKGWISTLIGVITMALTLILVWQRVFDFVWEGIAGLIIGVILIFSPQHIIRVVLEGFRAWGKRGNSFDYNDNNSTNYIEEDKKGDI